MIVRLTKITSDRLSPKAPGLNLRAIALADGVNTGSIEKSKVWTLASLEPA